MGGLLPFGSIFIEMYFIFTSFWNYKARLARLLVGLEMRTDHLVTWLWHSPPPAVKHRLAISPGEAARVFYPALAMSQCPSLIRARTITQTQSPALKIV